MTESTLDSSAFFDFNDPAVQQFVGSRAQASAEEQMLHVYLTVRDPIKYDTLAISFDENSLE